jgi:hypothetical protein
MFNFTLEFAVLELEEFVVNGFLLEGLAEGCVGHF